MKKILVAQILAICLIPIISVSGVSPAFEHSRESLTRTYDSTELGQSFIYGDKQFYNWNYSIPSDYAFNSTEINITDGKAHLLVNQTGSAGKPPFLKILSNGYYEVMNKRTQTSRHFYNETNGLYTYMSDELVQYQNEWITFSEYPIRYILRLRNSTIKTFDSATGISDYIALIDNSTIWGIGIESFNGVLGFYLNFQDVTNGHGQYLYYPRLRNGKLTDFNEPLYAIYPHIFAKIGAQWFDQLLNNRSLYSASQNPRNNLHFEVSSDTFELSFQTLDVNIQGFSWDIIQGFKYNTTTRLYHMITRFRCNDRGFDDIGMSYEITSSPQSDGTPYQPSKFRLYNETHMIIASVQQAWNIGDYFEDFYSRLDIISENNESFTFSFEDMETSGFTEKYLSLNDLELPNYETRKTLRAGMYGMGSYSQGEWINIDPTFSERLVESINDFDMDQSFAYDGWALWGGRDSGSTEYRIMIAYNSTIDEEIYSISNILMSLYLETEWVEANEYLSIGVYDSGDSDHIWDYDEAYEDTSGAHGQTTYYNETDWFAGNGLSGNQTFDDDDLSNVFDSWLDWHNSNPTDRMYIPFKFYNGDGMDFGESDYLEFTSSDSGINSRRPTLRFDYLLEAPFYPPEVNSPPDKDLKQGFTGENITWIPTERTNGTDSYVVYRNGSIFQSGSWSNQTPIIVSIDSINQILGVHNFTIFINDTLGNNATDSVFVTITVNYYYWTNPTITGNYNFSFNLTLRNFVVNSTTDINSSIKFQILLDTRIMFWDGSIWDDITPAQNNTYYFENESNNETVIDTYINELANEGNLSVRAFLHNSYNSTPYLDHIFIDTYNETIPVVGLFDDMIKDNSFSNLGFNFGFYTIKAYMDINAYNFTNGDNLTIYLLYTLPYTTFEFFNAIVLYKLQTGVNLEKEIDIPKISLQTLDIENSESYNLSLVNNYHNRDLVMLIERNGNLIFNLFLELEIVWYKTEVEIQPDFIEDIFAFDDPLDFPIFLLLMPLLFIFSGDQFGLIIGLTIGLVEVIAFLGIIRAVRSSI